MRTKAARLLATWFGCGYFPVAPGTAGSAAALAIAWLLVRYASWRPTYFAVLTLAALAPAIWASGVTAQQTQQRDPALVVVDEVLGQWVALVGVRSFNWKSYLGALLLFRLLDVWKPAPVRTLEALPGGGGIVADDLMAGAYAALVFFAAGCFNLY